MVTRVAVGRTEVVRDLRAAGCLAEGIRDLLDRIRGPRRLRLAGLPLGDPTARSVAARLPVCPTA